MESGGIHVESEPGEITQLLNEIRGGDQAAQARLIPLVYEELRCLAAQYMRQERPGHTLQTTALVHEAYLRLAKLRIVPSENRTHFFRLAAMLMRRILVDYARARQRKKRGGSRERIDLDDGFLLESGPSLQLLALDEALRQLERRDLRLSQIVELRFFGGLGEEEIAELLGISCRTVKRDWSTARAWLYQQVGK